MPDIKNTDSSTDYRKNIRRVDELIDNGNSFSGNEQNCAFLNLGDSTFATVSAVSQFDWPDDARSLALIDWDRDGDLDVWMTCRSAPMLRFLRNDSPPTNQSLLLKLEGDVANRDAIGARVEITLKEAPDKPLVQTLKAGEGFLGQSSRWLHFGLGKGTISSAKVKWPGGKEEVIAGLKPGHACHLLQNTKQATCEPFSPVAPATQAQPLRAKSAEMEGIVPLLSPTMCPPLQALTAEGKKILVEDTAGPLLVNLWASWCPDCQEELASWKASAKELASAGLHFQLLSADGRETQHQTTSADAFRYAKEQALPFPTASLTDEAFRRLTELHRQLFGANIDLPVPTSFLLNGKGQVVAVIRGKIEPKPLLSLLEQVKSPEKAMTQALLFPGRWLQPPFEPDPSLCLNDLIRVEDYDDALRFFQRHRDQLKRHKDFATFTPAFGSKLEAAKRPTDAISIYKATLEKAPNDLSTLNNLAWLLSSTPGATDPALAIQLATQAAQLTSHRHPSILDTLASAHAANGDFPKAIETAEKALALATTAKETALISSLQKALANYRKGQKPSQ